MGRGFGAPSLMWQFNLLHCLHAHGHISSFCMLGFLRRRISNESESCSEAWKRGKPECLWFLKPQTCPHAARVDRAPQFPTHTSLSHGSPPRVSHRTHSGVILSIRAIKRWRDALEVADIAVEPLPSIRPDKFRWNAGGHFVPPATPLHSFAVIQPGACEAIEAIPVIGAKKFPFLVRQMYRPALIGDRAVQTKLYAVWSRVVQQVACWLIRRPQGTVDPGSVATMIEAALPA